MHLLYDIFCRTCCACVLKYKLKVSPIFGEWSALNKLYVFYS